MPPPVRSPWLFRGITAAAGTVLGIVLLASAEWTARRVLPPPPGDATQTATRDYQSWTAGPCYQIDGTRLRRVLPPQGPEFRGAAPDPGIPLARAPGVRRIVIVGESTGEMLERALAALVDTAGCSDRVQVLQCSAAGALPGVAVRRAQEALAWSPDALVVALGHNFLLPGPPTALQSAVAGSRLARAVAGQLPSHGPAPNPMDPPPPMDPSNPEAPRDPVAMGREAYEAILAAARPRGVRVVALLLASNLRVRPRTTDTSYVASPERALAWVRWARNDPAGAALALVPAPGTPDEALRAYERANFHAEAGAWELARQDYETARDLEPASTRASSATTAAIATAARAGGATVLDVEALYAPLAAHGIPGWEVFFDHCHPNPGPLDLLARTVLGATAPEASACLADAAVAPTPEGTAAQIFQGTVPMAPVDAESAYRRLTDGPARVFLPPDPAVLDWDAYPDNGGWRRAIDGPFALVFQLPPETARAVTERYDREVLARFAPAVHATGLDALADAARDAGRLDLARTSLARAVALAPTAPVLVDMALIDLRAHDEASARADLDRARGIDPASAWVRSVTTALAGGGM